MQEEDIAIKLIYGQGCCLVEFIANISTDLGSILRPVDLKFSIYNYPENSSFSVEYLSSSSFEGKKMAIKEIFRTALSETVGEYYGSKIPR